MIRFTEREPTRMNGSPVKEIGSDKPRSDKARKPRSDKKPEGWAEFMAQQRNARRRSIPFLFTFEEWWAWWQVDGRWARRGRNSDGLVMARKGDAGPYSIENVYCTSLVANIRDVPQAVRAAAIEKMVANHARLTPAHLVPGSAHPRSRGIVTPDGSFGNVRMAAQHYGISPSIASRRAKAGAFGWRYA